MSDRDERLRWLCGLLLYSHSSRSVTPLERAEIGGLLSLFDRRNVARYIRETRDLGWVRFSLSPPREPGLTEALTEALGLRATVVSGPVREARNGDRAPAAANEAAASANGPDAAGGEAATNLGDPLKRVLGGAAAQVFVERLGGLVSREDERLQVGVSGGETTYHLIEALHASRELPDTPFEVIPVSRSLPPTGNSLRLSGGELASLLVDRVDEATAPDLPFLRYVPERAAVGSGARDVTQDLEKGLRARYERLDVVLTGIGGTDSKSVARIARDLGVEARPANLVGEMFGLPLDREVAEEAPEPLWQTGIGYPALDILRARAERAASEGRKGPHVVAVAGGPTKVGAILSAAGFRRAGASFERTAAPLITELVTDNETAEMLLQTLEIARNGAPPDREAQRRWVAGYLSHIHPDGLTHEQIRRELERLGLSDKQGDTSRRLEAAALVRASVTTPGRGHGELTPITIHTTAPPFARHELALTHLLRIDVRVAPGEGLERVAEAASDYFSEALAERRQELAKLGRDLPAPPALRIGIAGGRHLKAFVDRWPGADFTSESDPTVEIYPFVYRVPEGAPSDASLADLLTRRLRGSRSHEFLRYHPLDESQREAVLQIPYVSQYLEAAASVDFALLGIGTFAEGEGDGAKAHVCWRNLARDGRALPIVGPRPLGVTLEQLSRMFVDAEVERWRRVREPVTELKQVRSLHRLVAVASGLEKLEALEAVLSRNLRHVWAPGEAKSDHERLYRREEGFEPEIAMAPFLNVLIVDEPLAKELVDSLRVWAPIAFD